MTQETWLAVIEELDRFEGRSSLKTWIFRILANRAKTRGARNAGPPVLGPGIQRKISDPTMPADCSLEPGHRWAGHWAVPVDAGELPEEHLLSTELGGVLQQAIDALPQAQRAVVVLRDCQAFTSLEVRGVLGLSESNQRVLLDRGRLRVRAVVGSYADRGGSGEVSVNDLQGRPEQASHARRGDRLHRRPAGRHPTSA